MNSFRAIGFLAVALFAASSFASVHVVFLEVRGRDSKVLRLEPGESFAHVAIRVPGGWLHSHPLHGTEITTTLENYGRPTLELVLDSVPDPDPKKYLPWLGHPYDFNFDWTDESRLYCAEIIAKLTGLEPAPMTFRGSHWGAAQIARRGQPGLSPDEVLRQLEAKGARRYIYGSCPAAISRLF